jgi:hypothetical protein
MHALRIETHVPMRCHHFALSPGGAHETHVPMRCHHFALSPGGAHIPSSTPPHVPPIALPDNRFLSLSRFISFEHMQPPTHTCTHNEMGPTHTSMRCHHSTYARFLLEHLTFMLCHHCTSHTMLSLTLAPRGNPPTELSLTLAIGLQRVANRPLHTHQQSTPCSTPSQTI